jgi:hypothetical protein
MATMASHWRPQPRQLLSSHMTIMFQLQMSLQAIPLRSTLGQPPQLPLAQRTIRVPQQSPSRLPDPKVKALQHTQRLQLGSKTMMTMVFTRRLQHPSFDVPTAQRRNPLWVNSTATSRLTLCPTNATSRVAGSAKLHNGTSIVTKTRTGRFAFTFVPLLAAHGTSMETRSAFPDD